MGRLMITFALGGLILLLSYALHILSLAFIAGVICGLLLGMTLWLKLRRPSGAAK